MRLYGDSDALGTLPLTTPCVLGNEYLALFSFFFLKLAMHDKQFFRWWQSAYYFNVFYLTDINKLNKASVIM